MKDAYSPIFQEYVVAAQVGYHQMAELQVVCPCCREAVHRAEGQYKGKNAAFFKHYRIPKGLSVIDCDRRSDATSDSDKERSNQEARKQSLAIFRAVLRNAVAPMPVRGRLLPEADASWNSEETWVINATTAGIRQYVAATEEKALRNLTFRNSQRLLSIRGLDVRPFAEPSIRSSIAADLVRIVFLDNSYRTAKYLVSRAMYDCFPRASPFVEPTLRGRNRMLQIACETFHKDREDRGTLAPLFVLLDAVLRELERLPFEKMRTNAFEGERPMARVTIDDYLPHEDYPEFQYAVRKLDREKVAAFDRSMEDRVGSAISPGAYLYVDYDPETDRRAPGTEYRPGA